MRALPRKKGATEIQVLVSPTGFEPVLQPERSLRIE